MKNQRHLLAISQIVLAVFIWAASFIAMKIAVAELGAFVTVFLRMILAVAVLAFFLPKVSLERKNYQAGDGWLLAALILCEPCLYFVFEGLALTYTSASEAGMITSLHPFLVTIAAFYCLKEKVNSRMILGGLIAVAGALLLSVSGESTEAGSNHMLGNLLELVAIGFATGYSILARILSKRYSPVFLTTLQAVFGSLFFLPLALAFNNGMPTSISTQTVFCVLFLAWGVNVVAFILYNSSLKIMPASQVGLWMNLLPLATLVFAWGILDEQLTKVQYFAVALVLSGLIFSQIRPRRKTLFIEQSSIRNEDIEQLVKQTTLQSNKANALKQAELT